MKTQTGFSLVEIVIATAVIGIMLGGILSLFLLAARLQATSRRLSLATELAEREVEEFRNNQTDTACNTMPTELVNASCVIAVTPQSEWDDITVTIEYDEAASHREVVQFITRIGVIGQ